MINANLVLVGWFGVVLLLFAKLPIQRAVVTAFVAGILFLPEVSDPSLSTENPPDPIKLPMLPLTKQNTLSFSVILAAFIYDRKRLLSFRPRWVDLPMVILCVTPCVSEFLNDTPADPNYTSPLYDGIAATRSQLLTWGVPYVLGRIYFADLKGLRELAVGIVVGGVVYLPFCLYEARMSPQLHRSLYGYFQHDWFQADRDGFRPFVFMQHGLMVSLWMTAAVLMAFWLWRSKALRHLAIIPGMPPIPLASIVVCLMVMLVLTKSKGALVLGMVGVAALWLSQVLARSIKMPLAMIALMVIGPIYIAGRTSAGLEEIGWATKKIDKRADKEPGQTEMEMKKKSLAKPMFGWGGWSTRELLDQVENIFGEKRAESFEFRLVNEDRFVEKAMQRPFFGWGGWHRSWIQVTGWTGKEENLSTPDGLWIILLGDMGFVGLLALYAAMLLPVIRFMRLYPVQAWSHPEIAPAAAAALFLTLYMIDNLLNAMINPIFDLLAGGLAGLGAGVLSTSTPETQAPARPEPYTMRRPAPPETRRPGVLSRQRHLPG